MGAGGRSRRLNLHTVLQISEAGGELVDDATRGPRLTILNAIFRPWTVTRCLSEDMYTTCMVIHSQYISCGHALLGLELVSKAVVPDCLVVKRPT